MKRTHEPLTPPQHHHHPSPISRVDHYNGKKEGYALVCWFAHCHLFVCLSIHPSIHPICWLLGGSFISSFFLFSHHLSMPFFIHSCPYFHPSIHLFFLPFYPPIWPSLFLPFYPPIWPSLCLPFLPSFTITCIFNIG